MKHKKHVVKSFFKSRFYFILTLFILELVFIIVTTMFLSSFGQYKWITTTFRFLSVVIDMYFIIYILNSDKHPRYKLAWILLVAIFQVLGVFMYLIFDQNIRRSVRKGSPIRSGKDNANSSDFPGR